MNGSSAGASGLRIFARASVPAIWTSSAIRRHPSLSVAGGLDPAPPIPSTGAAPRPRRPRRLPPTAGFAPRCAAEPPQEPLPYGRWAERLAEVFLAACEAVEAEEPGAEVGEAGEIAWHPDRTYQGRTYVPATAPTSTGMELF